jgi:hypothetical protein
VADYDDVPGFAPPATRRASDLAVEPERRGGAEPPAVHPPEGIVFRFRGVVRRVAGSSTAALLTATVLLGGAVAVTRASDAPPGPTIPRVSEPAPTAPAPIAQVPDPSPESQGGRKQRPVRRTRPERVRDRFRFRATAPASNPAPSSGTSAPAPAPSAAREEADKPEPKPSPTPYTPTKILIRLTHPNGAYFFTTDQSTAIRKEGYDGFNSERAALVWAERKGPAMIRLELSDDSVGWIYSRESDVRTGDPAPLYAASTSRYGRFYSLSREQAAEVGPVTIYGWVATY